MPQFWVVAGPNGAGKTTVADRWLAPRIPVVSPDSIAASHGLSPIQAGKAAVREADRLLAAGENFAIDTTLAGNRELTLMKRAADAGYKVNLIFISVRSLELCQTRILERIDGGGHAVPPSDVARRYQRSLDHLAVAIDLADRVFVLDNTGKKRRLLFSIEHGRVKHLSNRLPAWANAAIPSHLIRSRGHDFGR
ncbi:MAG: AAA family ATPase [Ferrovum sp.]|jgi:predicted ABC-type ATPase|uniref:AAA family ATPase n=1 Tax=Ferrovum sp. TaxID=2609467 RepID=UPI0026172B0D|nr:AAA family ATPase [Ferrovum sp.]MBW8067788.1 AAA family ATPase [Ferrovum sp.]